MSKGTSKKTGQEDTSVQQQQAMFHTETIDLPSGGRCYPSESPLSSGKVELKYMTTKEEDILTSQNLIKKGIVIDRLLESLIVTPDVRPTDLLLGDKNGLLVAARILAYGPEYTVTVNHPNLGDEKLEHTFNLSDCEYKELPDDVDYTENLFEMTLPVSKRQITYKLLTGLEETEIDKTLKAMKNKMGKETGITTRLKILIKSVDDDSNKLTINNFVDNMLAKDALHLRQEIVRISPDINMKQEIEWEGESISVDIPMDIEFFWPQGGR